MEYRSAGGRKRRESLIRIKRKKKQLTDNMNHIFCPSLEFSSNIPSLLDTSRVRTLRHFFRAASLLHLLRNLISFYPLLRNNHYTKLLLFRNFLRSHTFEINFFQSFLNCFNRSELAATNKQQTAHTVFE